MQTALLIKTVGEVAWIGTWLSKFYLFIFIIYQTLSSGSRVGRLSGDSVILNCVSCKNIIKMSCFGCTFMKRKVIESVTVLCSFIAV